jgi:hypothetical protein
MMRHVAWPSAMASNALTRRRESLVQRSDRTLYILDVRDPAITNTCITPHAISAPGGQLVQATDQYVGDARCTPRAGRTGARGDDRFLAQADGLEGRVLRSRLIPLLMITAGGFY